MPICLLAWCLGLLLGNSLLVPALAPLLLAGAATVGGVATAAAAAVATVRSALLVVPVCLLLGLARGAASAHVVGPGSVDGHLGQRLAVVGTATRSGGNGTLQTFWLDQLSAGGRPLSGLVMVSARSPLTVVPGSRVRVTGMLERLPGRGRDNTAAYDDRMQRLGVLAAISGATFVILRPSPAASLPAAAWRARASLSAAVRARVPEPEAAILTGELVGLRSGLPAASERELVDSGLVHLLSVSGLKIALLAAALGVLLRAAGRPAALLAMAGIFAYAVVGGGSAAAVRAALLGSLSLLARFARRDPDPTRFLLLAASLMLGVTPRLGSDLSFQYSFLGVAGIHGLHPTVSRALAFLPSGLRHGLAVSIAAQLATLPLTAWYFHVLSPFSPLLNAIALPLLPASMLATLLLAAGAPDPLGLLAASGAGAAHLVLLLAHAGAAPGMVLRLPWFGPSATLAYGAALVPFLLVPRLPTMTRWRVGRGRARLLAAGAGVVLASLVMVLAGRPDGRLELVFLDTPGAGALVMAPDGARLLVDTGSSAPALRAALDAEMGPLPRRLDAAALTASVRAAAGGLDLLAASPPRLYLEPAVRTGEAPVRLEASVARAAGGTAALQPGDAVEWHGLVLEAEGCGAGISLTVRLGEAGAWFCSAGMPGDGGSLPPLRLAAVDIGAGGGTPTGPLGRSTWVVLHGSRAPTDEYSAARLGPRLWRTGRDGPLRLSCDAWACRRD